MLLASALYALSYVLQHQGTQQWMAKREASPDFAGKLWMNKIWVIGVLLFCVTYLVHMGALAFGSAALVQPLIVTELIFLPPIAALVTKVKVTRQQWTAIIVVTIALAGYLIVSSPSANNSTPSSTQWIIVTVGMIVAMAALVGLGQKTSPVVAAALCGTAAGLAGALMALTASGLFDGPTGGGISSLLTNPLLYVTVTANILTIVLAALAFRAGPITVSTPAMIGVNPIVALLISIWIFGVTIHDTPLDLIVIIICLAAVAYGVVYLTKSSHGEVEAAFTPEPPS